MTSQLAVQRTPALTLRADYLIIIIIIFDNFLVEVVWPCLLVQISFNQCLIYSFLSNKVVKLTHDMMLQVS